MSNLSEEEAILYLEHTAEDDFNLEEHQRHNRYLAIKTILDLYNKEKEKNKGLNATLTLVNIGLNDFISKDKIREKIKELERDKKKLYKEQGNIEEIKIYSVIDIIEAEILRFKELLEEEDV